jgi:hypothetical protein
MNELFEESILDAAEFELNQRRVVENWNRERAQATGIAAEPTEKSEPAWYVAAKQIFCRVCERAAFHYMQTGEPARKVRRRLKTFAERLSQRLWNSVRDLEPFTAFSVAGAKPPSGFEKAIVQALPLEFHEALKCYQGGGTEWRSLLAAAIGENSASDQATTIGTSINVELSGPLVSSTKGEAGPPGEEKSLSSIPDQAAHMVAPLRAEIVPEKRKRGRPIQISDELKRKALGLQNATNKSRAKVLYQTAYPTSQQVKNVPAILRHFRKKTAGKG